jgi:hypothetical protein
MEEPSGRHVPNWVGDAVYEVGVQVGVEVGVCARKPPMHSSTSATHSRMAAPPPPPDARMLRARSQHANAPVPPALS